MAAITTEAPSRREDRLVDVLGRTRRFRPRGGEQWLFVAGAALVVAGLVCISIAWVGTSRTVLVAGQIPYLVSGGLIGLGLVFLGGFLYFGHWLAVLVKEGRARADTDREDITLLRESIEELTVAIRGGINSAAIAPAQGAPISDAPRPSSGTLVATASGTMMHRANCAAVAGKSGVRQVTPADGLKACGICRPLAQESMLR